MQIDVLYEFFMNLKKKKFWIPYENNQFDLASALHFFRWSINIIKQIKYFNSKNPNQLSKLFNKYCYSQRFSCWKYCFFLICCVICDHKMCSDTKRLIVANIYTRKLRVQITSLSITKSRNMRKKISFF